MEKMQYRKLSPSAQDYAKKLYLEYRDRIKENVPDDKAAIINIATDSHTLNYIDELQDFFHFKVNKGNVIINQFFVDQMTRFCKW